MQLREQPVFLPGIVNAVAAFYNRCETRHRHRPDLELPEPPPEIRALMRILTVDQIPHLARPVALQLNRPPAHVEDLLRSLLALHVLEQAHPGDQPEPEQPRPEGTRPPPSPPKPRMVQLDTAVRIVCQLADCLQAHAPVLDPATSAPDRAALIAARFWGWRPLEHVADPPDPEGAPDAA